MFYIISFRAAAEHLGTSINVLRRRVDELERSLGIPVLDTASPRVS